MNTQELLDYIMDQLLKARDQDHKGQLAGLRGTINDTLVTILLEAS